jgi:hypothetical protein
VLWAGWGDLSVSRQPRCTHSTYSIQSLIATCASPTNAFHSEFITAKKSKGEVLIFQRDRITKAVLDKRATTSNYGWATETSRPSSRLKVVVGYEPAGDASISTTARATLMLSIIHGTATVRYCSVML